MHSCTNCNRASGLVALCTTERPNTKTTVFFREKSLLQGSQARGQEAMFRSVSPSAFGGVFIVEVGNKRGRGLGNDWWEVRGSFKSSFCGHDCPSRLFMGHTCNFGAGGGRVLYVTCGFSACDVQSSL